MMLLVSNVMEFGVDVIDNNRICYTFLEREEAGSNILLKIINLRFTKFFIVVVVICFLTCADSVTSKDAATDSLNIDYDQDKKQQMKKIRVLLTLLLGSKYLFKYCCARWIKISVEFHSCYEVGFVCTMAEIGCNWARIGPSKSSQSLSIAHKWAVEID
ncbi:hypothetical protein Tco_0862744 [Tanacetum coccineum]